jgi:hypothetical protein
MAGRDLVGNHEEAGQKVKKRFAINKRAYPRIGSDLLGVWREGRGAAGEFIYRD